MTKDEYDSKVLSLKGTHDYNMLCFIRGQYIESLEAEIAELKSQAIVWHKYPDEKPEPSHEYEVNVPVIIAVTTCYTLESDFADYNIDSDTFWRYGTKYKGITHWAYLPELPKEEK